MIRDGKTLRHSVTKFTFCNKKTAVLLIVCQMKPRCDHILKKEKMAVHVGLPRIFYAVNQVGGHLCQKNSYTENGLAAMEFVTARPTRLPGGDARSASRSPRGKGAPKEKPEREGSGFG
ncbi:hypothetical protein AB4Y32_00665 [Paraburkholderia phymatum]|uniref:Uncharacterized protein n=1 Tax=Paraburkholderia phymatum TaxID=148447 RepID=A0ACC6TSD2_9BURK